MINYVIYSNTDYLDVLKIQTDHVHGLGHTTLFINQNDLDMSEIYSKYDNVIFYNNDDAYAKRLLSCVNQLDMDYFLLVHDIDIVVDVDKNIINDMFDYMKKENVDRIDLKFSEKTFSSIPFKDDLYLVKQLDSNNFIYNVNPSIWRKSALTDVLAKFHYKSYRTIEDMDVQFYCNKFKVFKLHSSQKMLCGYFNCVKQFMFLHISHSGKLLPLTKDFVTVYGQSYADVSEKYINIVNKYDLKSSPKWIQ